METRGFTTEALKPCPFCGGQARKQRTTLEIGNIKEPRYFVSCISCAAEGGWAKTEGGAVRNWEMREHVGTP